MAEDKNKPSDKSGEMPKTNALDARVREAVKSLKFRTNKKIEVENEPVRFVPDERPMLMTDVISYADVDGKLVIVSSDGRKHRIAA